MTRTCGTDLLERWVVGELDAESVAMARAHAAACRACARELAWLRAERRAFGDRIEHDASRAPAFAAVLRRASGRRSVLARWADALLPERRLVAFAACAATALFFAVQNHPAESPPARALKAAARVAEPRSEGDSDALCTFDAAEEVSHQLGPEDSPAGLSRGRLADPDRVVQPEERECSEPEVSFTPLSSMCETPSL